MSLEQVNVDVSAILKPYFSEISSLNESLKQHENMVDYYTLKSKMINDEIDNQLKQLNQEEIELSQKFITCVENEEFFIHPTEENVELINNAKQYKDVYNKKKEHYITQMKQIENKEKALNDKLNRLDSEKQELYKIICDLILNNGKNLQSDNKKEEELINNNQGIIKVIKAKCSQIKNKSNTKETKRTRSFSNSNNNNNRQHKGNSVNKNTHNKKRHYNISSSPNKTYNNASNYSISSSQIALNTKHKDNVRNNTSNNNHNKSNSKNKMNGHRKRFNSSLSTKPKKNNSYSNIPIHLTNQSNVHNNNNNNNHNVSSIAIKNNACDNIKNTNKSFFLLKNARLEKSLKHSSDIMSQEDLGGEYCCYKLLRNYKNDLKNVEDLSDDSHYLNKSSSNQYSKALSVSRYKNNCNRSFTNEDKSLRRERLEYKLSNTPKLCVRGKYVNQNLIGQATDTENGIL